MERERWQRVNQIVNACLELKPEEREAAISKACDGDLTLMAEVAGLLDSYEQVGDFLEPPVSRTAPSLAPLDNPSITRESGLRPISTADGGEAAGPIIERYRLLQKIGEGGMGEVWLAEQQRPVRRRVALKLIKAGMNSRDVIARFESERQALALMDHSTIAKVFDAGSTAEGSPYFVMEYVPGVPITEYCEIHRLTIRERLELFTQVCEGVQHAHQKAIIHRDLKPSNILVSEVDGRAAPKIIDFGVAKALTQRLTADTMFTRVGAIIGTPQYMSPEQAVTSGEDIDTRTDVYSLGIILYELLVGIEPLELRNIPFAEFLRRLQEEEPLKPSTRMRTQDAMVSSELARRRQTEPLALARQLRGDLDSIVLKALEKDRSQRYASSSDLAADIRRYLNNEAVLAVPPSTAYRVRKFVSRYRAVLVTACAFGLLLLGAAGVSVWQGVRATRQRDRADAEAAASKAVNDFLQNDLLAQASASNQSGPATKPDPDLKVRTALDRAASRIKGRFEGQPQVEADILDTIGQTYMDLGLYSDARMQSERALELHKRAGGAQDPKTLKTLSRLAYIADLQGRYPEAETLFSQTVEAQRRVLGPEHPDTLHSSSNLADVYRSQGKYKQAEALDHQILEIRRRSLGPEHPETLSSMNNLALVYHQEGQYAQAEALYGQTLETKRRVLGPEHPSTLGTMNNLGLTYQAQGKYAQAQALYAQAFELMRRVLGSEHPTTLIAMTNLAGIYFEQGQYGQSALLYSQTLETRRRVLGPEHPNTLSSMNNLALAYGAEGRYAQAEQLFTETLALKRRVLGPEHPNTLTALSDLASLYQRQGKYELAESFGTQTLAGRRHSLGSEHPSTMASAADLALTYISQGKFSEGEALAREALEFNRKKQPDNWQRFRAESLLGAGLFGEKRYAEAELLLVEGYQGMVMRKDRIDIAQQVELGRTREWVVQLYQEWGKPAKVSEWKK
jgi:serine/threonine protein kinase/Flp pilus assembly protein TadD